jgi:hypothetical protein
MLVLVIIVFIGMIGTGIILGTDQLMQEAKQEKEKEELRKTIQKGKDDVI